MIDIRKERRGSILIFRLTGRLDSITSPLVENAFMEEVRQGTEYYIFDLGGVNFVSSAGIRLFFLVSDKTSEIDGQMVITSPAPIISNVINMTGYANMYPVMGTENEAIHYLSSLNK